MGLLIFSTIRVEPKSYAPTSWHCLIISYTVSYFLCNFSYAYTISPSEPVLRYLPNGNETYIQHSYTELYNRFIHNCQTLATAPYPSTSGWITKKRFHCV